jgi:hypothetical protein
MATVTPAAPGDLLDSRGTGFHVSRADIAQGRGVCWSEETQHQRECRTRK